MLTKQLEQVPLPHPVPMPAEGQRRSSQLPAIYYDDLNMCYRFQDERGEWIQEREAALERRLIYMGFSSASPYPGALSPVDEILVGINTKHAASYIGPLAGFSSGFYIICGKRALITESPAILEPREGDWSVIRQFIEGLLVGENVDQRPYFFGWLKVGYETRRAGRRRPGQALTIAGPHNCGKSFAQNEILTPTFGGRSARPYQFMTGGTTFNSDIFAAEHLMVEDEAASAEHRARRHFGAMIKSITATDESRCHPKFGKPVMLTPFWRLSITVNDEPENLMVLPILDESLKDKMIILKAFYRPMPMPTNTDEERNAFIAKIREELPCFLHFLCTWSIPEDLRSARYGITHYHHPDILAAIADLAPEDQLLGIIDNSIFRLLSIDPEGFIHEEHFCPWEGTSGSLEEKLTSAEYNFQQKVRKLLSFNTACGVYLGRLAKKYPERVSERRIHGQRIWKIMPPSGEVSGCQGVSGPECVPSPGGAPGGQGMTGPGGENPSDPTSERANRRVPVSRDIIRRIQRLDSRNPSSLGNMVQGCQGISGPESTPPPDQVSGCQSVSGSA
ncbi:MAG: hypothetical protein PHV34_17175 [Verrucomicrobiae bacterium]|nr:hypothetical protein [Verrucomicrobiae bacterium]